MKKLKIEQKRKHSHVITLIIMISIKFIFLLFQILLFSIISSIRRHDEIVLFIIIIFFSFQSSYSYSSHVLLAIYTRLVSVIALLVSTTVKKKKLPRILLCIVLFIFILYTNCEYIRCNVVVIFIYSFLFFSSIIWRYIYAIISILYHYNHSLLSLLLCIERYMYIIKFHSEIQIMMMIIIMIIIIVLTFVTLYQLPDRLERKKLSHIFVCLYLKKKIVLNFEKKVEKKMQITGVIFLFIICIDDILFHHWFYLFLLLGLIILLLCISPKSIIYFSLFNYYYCY